MPSELTIEPYEAGLRVRVWAPLDLLRLVLVGVAMLFLYLLFTKSDTRGWKLVLVPAFASLALLSELVSAARGTKVVLIIRNLDFVSRGHAPAMIS
jgi:hypothetical protein